MTHSPEGAKARADDVHEEEVVVTSLDDASAEDLRAIESRMRLRAADADKRE